MRAIDAKRAVKLIEKVVTKHGENFVYEIPDGGSACVYADKRGKPSCLIAKALRKARVSKRVIAGLPPMKFATAHSAYLLVNQGVHVTLSGQRVFAAAQMVQDQERSWGEALEAARRAAESA